ncbi:serine/threonine protein kinase, putative [Trypanosoma cruzi marinkellei]|uniref:Serine/threonine protein kinase, putative n=1 Tax=Trypanosoma cruzi marinkellei TaxID=85056 RepID=K2LZ91_TRYCR|nr:serine/threonine protein kinase, putative [Trypanosoma cruzi marinkellei]
MPSSQNGGLQPSASLTAVAASDVVAPQQAVQSIAASSTTTTAAAAPSNANSNMNHADKNNNNNNNNNHHHNNNTNGCNGNNTNSKTAATLENTQLHPRSALFRPSVALSQEIMPLYRLINSKYSEERRCRQPGPKYNDGYDDRHGHYLVFTGEVIWGRYTVQGILGRGSFGTVLKCFDEKHQEQVAAKVIRSGEYFYNQGLMEVDIVARLNSVPPLENLVVRLGKVFVWKGHLVLVFEMLSMNLFQLIQRTNYNGVSLDLTRKFAYQLILVLKQLEEHNPPIIHCDVKPENVVLRDPSRSSIRLVDFGSACYLHQGAKLYKYVQSRFYRSVEVILELGYDTAIDRWSLGCMLVELHTGVPLFAGKNEADQIARFIGVLGPLPDEMIERSPKKDFFFVDSRQAQQEAFLQHAAGMGGGGGGGTVMAEQTQRREHVASPSPVIAAEVLHSLSATSSISVVTAASTAPACSYVGHSDVAARAVATPPHSQQQQQLAAETIGAATDGWQAYRNSFSTPGNNVGTNNNNNNNNNTVVVPALRRPKTAHSTALAAKKDGIGHTTIGGGSTNGGGGGGSFTPAVTRRSKHTTSGNPSQQKTHLGANATAAIPMMTLPTRSSAAVRASTFTPRPRLTSASHPIGHNEGSLPSSARGTRAGMQQAAAAAEPPQQSGATAPPKSPFVLRYPPAPEHYQSLEETIGVYSGGPRGCRQGQAGHGVEDYKVFLDFVQRLLCYDPRKRMSCTEALQHPFLSELEVQKQWKT